MTQQEVLTKLGTDITLRGMSPHAVKDLLNVGYFHVVFTVPQELNALIYANQEACCKLLFHCVAQTLKELSADKKYLAADIGLTAVLHTWGQNLSCHPHIHCVVPAGDQNSLGLWVDSQNCLTENNHFEVWFSVRLALLYLF